ATQAVVPTLRQAPEPRERPFEERERFGVRPSSLCLLPRADRVIHRPIVVVTEPEVMGEELEASSRPVIFPLEKLSYRPVPRATVTLEQRAVCDVLRERMTEDVERVTVAEA